MHLINNWFNVPTAETPIFVHFLNAWVLFDGAFSLWVSLKSLHFHITVSQCHFPKSHKLNPRCNNIPFILTFTGIMQKVTDTVIRRCYIKKEKHLCRSLFFIKLLATLLKMRLRNRYFPVHFPKILRTSLTNTSGNYFWKCGKKQSEGFQIPNVKLAKYKNRK